MPCRTDDDDEGSALRTYEELNRVTALLCDACNRLEIAEFMPPSGALTDWWREHKKADAVRKEQERKDREKQARRRAALAKLSPADRKLLGL